MAIRAGTPQLYMAFGGQIYQYDLATASPVWDTPVLLYPGASIASLFAPPSGGLLFGSPTAIMYVATLSDSGVAFAATAPQVRSPLASADA